MNFNYSPTLQNIFFEDLEKLSIEEQNEKLKIELKVSFLEQQEMLNHITFLNSQISKYQNASPNNQTYSSVHTNVHPNLQIKT